MPNLVGIGLSQVPTNSMLGGMAYQDPEHASIKDLDLKNLSQINSEISDTAITIFVYDTSKDSDGGAWRKRTQHTSWYNETLNTSTRGSRREFPSIAVIVVQNAPTQTDPMITIYDGDDPDLPMWMVFRNNISGGGNDQRTSRSYYAAGPYQSVGAVMKNGILVDGQERSSGHLNGIVKGITKHDFIADTSLQITDEGMFKRLGNLGNERNVVKGYNKVHARSALAYTQINALAITVLPNAPINPKTGMKVPTIAIASESGVQVLRYEPSDGYPRIYDYYNTAGTHDNTTAIDFNEEGQIIYSWDNGSSGSRRVQITPILAIDENTVDGSSRPRYGTATMGFGGYQDSGNYDGHLIGRYVKHIAAMKGRTFAAGDVKAGSDPGGLSIVDASPQFGRVDAGKKDSLIAHISSSYNTGWMQGDIKFAGLADTDATNRNAETENLITGQNHDYDTNTGENWTSQSSATATYSSTQGVGSSGAISMTSSGGSNVYSSIQFSGLTVNTKYVLYFLAKTTDASRNTSFNVSDGIHNTGTNFAAVNQTFVTANSYHPIEISFKTNSGTSAVYFSVYAQQGGGGTLYLDEFYIVPAELDHIQDGAGIAVYGSINKTAVATGSELVAYSNFGASNWLVQPYGSGDLNFGTGNFSISGWFNLSDISTTGFIVDRASMITSGGGSRFAVYTESSQLKFYTFDNSAFSEESASLFTGMNTSWVHFVCNRMSSGQMEIYLDGQIKSRTERVVRDVSNSVLSRCVIGHRFNAHPTSGSGAGDSNAFDGSLALIKISGSCPTAEEVSKMYRDERRFYAENAKVTLYGTSDAVSGLAYDSTTNLLHVGTSAGRSDFEGLCRINNTTTAVTTDISASNGLIAEQ